MKHKPCITHDIPNWLLALLGIAIFLIYLATSFYYL